MEKNGYWVIRTYESGPIGEKTKYWVPGERATTVRGRRNEKKAIKKAEQNEHAAVKALARLLNANYKAGDILLGLTYSDEGILKVAGDGCSEDELRERAEHEATLCIRRVKRELAKDGIDLKYVLVTSDMDGDTGECVRVHHHLVVPSDAIGAFEKKWKLGTVHYTPMRHQDDYTPIAEYLMRQVRRIPDEKKYVSSRNLIRPVPRDRVAMSGSELRVPSGGKILYRAEFRSGSPQYIRYVLPKNDDTSPPLDG